ncbi:MAG TPA: winged helix-turn-helix transcriptional regulator [Solirubrobacterales bacterium]|nr:winged helix-turn-helix transcriptional regulator [Solirubrobacterales bacterium]
MRAGAHALSLLSVPLNVEVLRALDAGPTALVDLRRAVGSPAETTMRAHLRELTELGVLERRRHVEFPGPVDCRLGAPGAELAEVADALRSWLDAAPDGPLTLGTMAATGAIKALIGGWSSTIVRALAARPLPLTDLNRLIHGINYPTLERRLAAMRLTGMVRSSRGRNRSRPYSVTGWLRRAPGPLAAAALWERHHLSGKVPPIAPLDAEAALLLAVPALRLGEDLSGVCRLAVSIRNGGEERLAGVRVGVEEGRVASCVSKLAGRADAWASGSASDWIRAVIDGDPTLLEIGGDCDLTLALIDGLNAGFLRAEQVI